MCLSDIEGLVAETVKATIPVRGEGDGVVMMMGVENEGDPECGIESRSGTRGKWSRVRLLSGLCGNLSPFPDNGLSMSQFFFKVQDHLSSPPAFPPSLSTSTGTFHTIAGPPTATQLLWHCTQLSMVP